MDYNSNLNVTDFDMVVSAKELQIMKAAIPYIPTSEQKFISIYVKFAELMKTLQLFRNSKEDSVGICSVPEESRNPTAMLNAIKCYLDDNERETIDLLTNFVSASSIYSNFKKQNESNGDSNSKGNNMDMMSMFKSMLSPEQSAMFDTYSSVFSGLS